MLLSGRIARRAVAGAIGAGAIAGATLFGAATAAADPPNCTAADLAGVSSGVSAETSAYLLSHPDVNAFFTGLKGQPKTAIRNDVQTYLDQNPQVKADLQGIRQPLVDLKNRCGGPQAAPAAPQ
ncbi:heme-binding protein [Mycobacterium sp.]|jgi:hemophore-related protein|uniref:heme-binding protein n=1 Tax=Mycobacterium sp. TaxID=1785 RepID=UPI002D714E51|nr:heme-binding protein [Mycobacterium sp.]HZA11283.1 heme-binding protein [Mycobacterium sp.]